jgi:tyrosine-protein kinase Etk/Wzc
MAQQTIQPETQRITLDEPQSGLDMFDILLIFARRKWMLLGFIIAGALALFLWTLTQPKLYEADAIILPPQEQQSGSSLMGQLSVLTGLAGGASALKSPSDLYVGLLGSRNIREHIVTEFGLDKIYGLKKVKDAQGLLGSRTKISSDKAGLITVKVRDKDAKRSAELANAYANGLFDLNSRLAVTQASQRRVFFDQQLEEEKNHLADAEVALKETEEKTGMIQLNGQTSIVVSQIAQLRANISSHEVQLAALRASSTDDNPQVIQVQSELDGLRTQLRQMEGKAGMKDDNDLGLSSAEVPGVGLDYIRKERDVTYHQTLFELLARQLEAARIDEAKAAPIVQLLDKAEVPDFTTYPKTKLLTALGAVLGLMLGGSFIVLLYLYDAADEDPLLHKKMWAVKAALRGRGW